METIHSTGLGRGGRRPAVLAALAAGLAAAPAAGAGIPASLLIGGDLPEFAHVLSPDGERMLLWRKTEKGARTRAADRASGRLLGPERPFRRVWWGADGDTFYGLGRGNRIHQVSLAGAGAVIPIGPPGPRKWRVVRYPTAAHPRFVVHAAGPRGLRLLRCAPDFESLSACEPIAESRRDARAWLFTPDRRNVARIRWPASGRRLFEALDESGSWHVAFSFDADTVLKIRGPVQPDGTVWALSNRGRGTAALVKLDVRTGREETVFAHDRFDIEDFVVGTRDGMTHRPLLATYLDPAWQRIRFFDDGVAAAFRALEGMIGKQPHVRVMSADRGPRFLTAQVVDERHGRAIYLLDAKAGKARRLATMPLAKHRGKFSPTEHAAIEARDGRRIYAYLNLPGRASGKGPPPMVLIPHGGPRVRHTVAFDRTAQFLADRGYAVLRLNYRGSAGINRAFQEAGYGQLFGAVLDDVVDAAEWAVAKGHARRGGIAVYGASFGGLLALAAMARNPGAFQAGIAINAVADAEGFWKAEWRRAQVRGIWRKYFRSDGYPAALMAEHSPLRSYKKIASPLLLIAGSGDKRIPVAHSRRLFDLMNAAGKEVKLLEYERLGHKLWRTDGATRVRFHDAALRFLDQRLGRRAGGG